MLETKILKDIESAFRQFGYEAEDIFKAIAYQYSKIFSIKASKKLREALQKGNFIVDIVSQDDSLKRIIDFYIEKDKNGDNLTIFYQYFLAKRFRDITGKFFTPYIIAEQMAKMLPVKPNAVIIDPTCGGGTFLKTVRKQWKHRPCHLIGNDIDPMLICLTELVLKVNKNNHQKVSLLTSNIYQPNQQIKSFFGKIDYILANPPFSLPIDIFTSNSRLFQLGYRNSDALFIDLSFELLKPGGRLVCLLPHSIISNKESQKLRQVVEENWHLTAVIILPEGIFKSTAKTTTRADIIILDKKRNNNIYRNKKTIFANISSVGLPLNGRRKKIESNDLEDFLKNSEVSEVLGI